MNNIYIHDNQLSLNPRDPQVHTTVQYSS